MWIHFSPQSILGIIPSPLLVQNLAARKKIQAREALTPGWGGGGGQGYSGFQVTGMIEGLFLGLKFPIQGFFLGRKIWQVLYFLCGLIYAGI